MTAQIQPGFVFRCRASSLRAKIADESNVLRGLSAPGQAYSSFANALRVEMEKLANEITVLLEALGVNGTSLPHLSMERIQLRAMNLFGEALALRLADSIRGHLDLGMCRIADSILAELAEAVTVQVPHLSTVAEAEYYGASSRVIRLRYPTKSIWDLPVLAHEYGHSFGPAWTVKDAPDLHPHETFVHSGKLGSQTLNDEYFCDLLATFLLGPAYVSMCILERFNPSASTDNETHPSDLKRAYWVLCGLDLLAELVEDDEGSADYRSQSKFLRSIWDGYRSSCSSEDLTETEKAILEFHATGLFAKFQTALPLAAYTNSSAPWELVADYKDGMKTQSGKKFRDILNASWLVRVRHGTDPRTIASIAEWALELARRSLT